MYVSSTAVHFHYPANHLFPDCDPCNSDWEQQGKFTGQIWEWNQRGRRVVVSDGADGVWFQNPDLACVTCGLHLGCRCALPRRTPFGAALRGLILTLIQVMS